jgi:hypothetical protein
MQKRMEAKLDTCQEKMDTNSEKTDLESNPRKLQSTVVHQVVPKWEVAVETVRTMEDQYGKWHQTNGGSQRKLAAAHRQMTRHAVPAPHKGHSRQGPGRTFLQEEPLKDECSRGDKECTRRAAME